MKLKKCLAEVFYGAKERMRAKLAPIRRKAIVDTSFTIISNNCWAGIVYQRYGLQYATPTVGVYFFAEDYIRFISNLRHYLSIPVQMISVDESVHRDVILKRHHEIYPIGRIDDVEIVFRHYKTEQEALEKWERRKKRVNFGNLIVKFSEMNQCNEELLKRFGDVPFDTKFAFVTCPEKVTDRFFVHYHGYEKLDHIPDDTKYYSRNIDINALINHHEIVSKSTGMWK